MESVHSDNHIDANAFVYNGSKNDKNDGRIKIKIKKGGDSVIIEL